MTVQDWSNAMDIKELQNIIQENGVVGAGGAGFPTYMKLTDKANTILMNCAECEPLLKLHRQLLEKHAYEIMKTFHMVQETVGASEAIIGIKKSYVQTVNALKQHIEEFPGMRIHLLDEVYPMGDEVVLIYEATGRVVRPGGLPIEQGVAVFNVETLYNIYQAVEKKEPVTSKYVSVVAEVNHPVTVKVPLGCTMDDVVAQAHEKGYAETLFGRRRYIPELKAKNPGQRGFGERTAMNHPMQGTAADIIKLAMRQVMEKLVEGPYDAKLLLQVHDELDLSVPQNEVEEVSAIVKKIMESVVELSVPLVADVSNGRNWAEAH